MAALSCQVNYTDNLRLLKKGHYCKKKNFQIMDNEELNSD